MQREFMALNEKLPSAEALNSVYIIINWKFLHLFKQKEHGIVPTT